LLDVRFWGEPDMELNRLQMTQPGHWARSVNWRNVCAIGLGGRASLQLFRPSHLLGGNMTNRFLFALIVLFSFAEATPPAGAFPVSATVLDMRSTDTSGAFILVRKGKGHGDGEERFERHHRRHSHGMRGFNGNQGFGNYSGFGGGNQNQPNGQN
jgi:hypothetical protein